MLNSHLVANVGDTYATNGVMARTTYFACMAQTVPQRCVCELQSGYPTNARSNDAVCLTLIYGSTRLDSILSVL